MLVQPFMEVPRPACEYMYGLQLTGPMKGPHKVNRSEQVWGYPSVGGCCRVWGGPGPCVVTWGQPPDICEQTDRKTHLTENISFPQLRLRVVNVTKSFPKAA